MSEATGNEITMAYERSEDGVTTVVTEQEGLAEGRAAMADRVTDRALVRTVSLDSGRYDIAYKDDRHVVLRPVAATFKVTRTVDGTEIKKGDEVTHVGWGDPGVFECVVRGKEPRTNIASHVSEAMVRVSRIEYRASDWGLDVEMIVP